MIAGLQRSAAAHEPVVNLKTAKALRLRIGQPLLPQATEVIE